MNLPKSHFCICGSTKLSSKCCGRFLSLLAYPKTPEQLMRSRYSAFTLGGYGQYLLDTWLPAMTQGMTAEELSQANVEWLGLEILQKSQKHDDGFVEFIASYLDENGDKAIHHEKSIFKRISGKWLYVGGEVEQQKAH